MAEWQCLAIEAATEHASVALARDERRWTRTLSSGRNSSRELYSAIGELLRAAGIALAELDCIACGHGPGSFTGVRVAVGAAQGLGYAQRLPVIGVSSLAALAGAAGRLGVHGVVLPCLDARMGEVYLGRYRCTADAPPVEEVPDRLLSPGAVAAELENEQGTGVGPGWLAYPELTGSGLQLAAATDAIWPTAEAVLELAAERYAAGERGLALALTPRYLRDKVVNNSKG